MPGPAAGRRKDPPAMFPPGPRTRIALALLAGAGLAVAWWLYPRAHHYSILTSTISYLGSPDPDRNPGGWRFYQAGMSSLIGLMLALLQDRHGHFQGRRSLAGRMATVPLVLGMAMLLVAVWIPDSRTQSFLGEKATHVHTRLAILAIPVLGLGLVLDTVGRLAMGVHWHRLWPAGLFALLVAVGFWKLAEWEALCRANPQLRHWPGDGIHSTPLWEWITFCWLVAHLHWMARPWRSGEAVQSVI